MLTMADLPLWLRDWCPGHQIRAEDFFAYRVVFYPGSGTDGQPVKFFGSPHAAHSFVFADYGVTKDHLLQELGDDGRPFAGYRSAGRTELSESDLTPSGWTPHIHSHDVPLSSIRQGEPYGFIEILERRDGFDDSHGPKRLAILFLWADGVAAYDALFCQSQAKPSFAIVLQDHGVGGNWTTFGRGGSLEQLASTTGRFPEFLLVADNTLAWNGYSVVEGADASRGGMHNNERRLWRRDRPIGEGHSASDDFHNSFENNAAAKALVARVIALCEMRHVRHHHTCAARNGDLRVQADRPTPHPRQQNVITMVWIPN